MIDEIQPQQDISDGIALIIILCSGLVFLVLTAIAIGIYHRHKAMHGECEHNWNTPNEPEPPHDTIVCKKCKKSLAEINY